MIPLAIGRQRMISAIGLPTSGITLVAHAEGDRNGLSTSFEEER